MDSKKKNGAAALIVSGLPKPSKEPSSAEGEGKEMSDEAMAASDVMDAIGSKDSDALATALKGFIEICKGSESYAEDDSTDLEE